MLTVRAMLRDGMDPAAVAAVTGVPRVLVEVILAEDLNRHQRSTPDTSAKNNQQHRCAI
jgi:hypothetical protein